ncbi:MAG: hypothetical protein ACTFAK_10980 [Candidatus Electronema sp. VV]
MKKGTPAGVPFAVLFRQNLVKSISSPAALLFSQQRFQQRHHVFHPAEMFYLGQESA